MSLKAIDFIVFGRDMLEEWPADLRPEEKRVLLDVLAALREMTHGHLQIIVQDSRVVQIDRTQKFRYVPSRKQAS